VGKMLVIIANPRKVSYTRRIVDAFLGEYQRLNPADAVTELDLYQTDIPVVDDAVLQAWNKPRRECSAAERQLLERIDAFTDPFIAADKIMFAAPMWNLQFPPALTAYLAMIMVAGKTFEYTQTGCRGLVPNKPVALLHVRGGVYSSGPLQTLDFAAPYLQSVCAMIGLSDFRTVLCEGVEIDPGKVEQLVAQAKDRARELARNF
jgi:FMN-dependent NADH-azoreductase